MSTSSGTVVSSVEPLRAVDGGRLILRGSGLAGEEPPVVTIGETPARVAFSSPRRIAVLVPPELEGGNLPVRLGHQSEHSPSVSIGRAWATGLHQVDNPVLDAEGRLYVTYSGTRGQEAPVSIFRVTRQETREPYASGI